MVAFSNTQVQRASSILWATDSRSELEALDGNISKASDQVQQLWRQIARLVNIGLSVTALWVPSDCGLSENEKADFLANKAIKMPFKQHSKSHIRYEEVKELTRQRQPTRLLCIKDVYPGKQKDYLAHRVEVVLNQLPAGCSPLVRTFRTTHTIQHVWHARWGPLRRSTTFYEGVLDEQVPEENILEYRVQ